MAENEVKVIISGEAGGAIAALQEAAAAAREGFASIKESMLSVKEVSEGLTAAFAGISGLAAGGIFKEFVAGANEWTEAAIQTGLAMGVSTEAATAWNVAIKEVGGNATDVQAAAAGLTRQLRMHEKALQDMGIATRDANGNVLDMNTLMQNAVEAVNQYEAGTDRTLAAQVAFGRGVSTSNAIFRVHGDTLEHARQKMEELGLAVEGRTQEAFEKNRVLMADLDLVGQSFSNTIGNRLIPVLIDVGQAFSSQAGTGAEVFGQIITWTGKAVMELWYGLKELGTMLGGLGAAAAALITGNFAGASQIMRDLKVELAAMSIEGDKAVASIGKLRDSGDDLSPIDPGSHKKFHLPEKEDKGDNRLALYKNALTEMNQARGDFDAKDIAADRQYWQSILDNTGQATEKDRVLRTQIQKEILALDKRQHDEEIKMAQEAIKSQETLALGEVTAKKVQLDQDLATRRITQAQAIAGEAALENQIFAIKQKAIADDLALAQFDQVARQKLKDQELVLEQQHAAALQAINNKAALEQRKAYDDLFKSMQSGFTTTIDSFLKGTQSLAQTVQGLFRDIVDSIISTIAKMAAQWLTTTVSNIIESKTSAVAIIGGLAAQAGAGAFAATAAIPIVGPELAPAAGAAAYSQALAYGAVASAAGGYDIPPGVNPMTQLHQNEMVLPAPLADVVRGMARGGVGGGGNMSVHVSAMDSRDVARQLQKGGVLHKELKRLHSALAR